jgi:hypothetical protein
MMEEHQKNRKERRKRVVKIKIKKLKVRCGIQERAVPVKPYQEKRRCRSIE